MRNGSKNSPLILFYSTARVSGGRTCPVLCYISARRGSTNGDKKKCPVLYSTSAARYSAYRSHEDSYVGWMPVGGGGGVIICFGSSGVVAEPHPLARVVFASLRQRAKPVFLCVPPLPPLPRSYASGFPCFVAFFGGRQDVFSENG